MKARIFRMIGSLTVAGLLLLMGGQPALAQAGGTVSPREGVPGYTFTFHAPGFQGAVPQGDADDSPGERVSYWVTLPDGSVIATVPQKDKDSADRARQLEVNADGHGLVAVAWSVPDPGMAGQYMMTLKGQTSGYTVKIPFLVHPDGWQTVVQAGATPAAGPAGAEFRFVATGFRDAGEDRGKAGAFGEPVSYWINTPDGGVIASEECAETQAGNETRPLLHEADSKGTVNLVWFAPAGLKPGAYSIVFHGLESHAQVQIFFTIR